MNRIRVLRHGNAPGDDRKGLRPMGSASGLPAPLPANESLLWQGSPEWRVLLRRALHVRAIAAYFAVLMVWCLVVAVRTGSYRMWFSLATLAVLGSFVLGMAALYAWLVARTTMYTITERRVVLKAGIALSMSINLPYKAIDGASLRLNPDGTGDIPLLLEGPTRIGFTQLWPHVRPWRMNRVQPMLRAIPDAARVAQLLSAALAASAGQATQPASLQEPAPRVREAARATADAGA
ncbi:photosynthetic complex putative assembly protein PuhB [Lichenicola sp.]|uniref:photosynthetic complex putative assembly protein PuhB n=1 Tax=Lichenicola sp. TaxID=2804529 RepID=UPI003AFF664C